MNKRDFMLNYILHRARAINGSLNSKGMTATNLVHEAEDVWYEVDSRVPVAPFTQAVAPSTTEDPDDYIPF